MREVDSAPPLRCFFSPNNTEDLSESLPLLIGEHARHILPMTWQTPMADDISCAIAVIERAAASKTGLADFRVDSGCECLDRFVCTIPLDGNGLHRIFSLALPLTDLRMASRSTVY